MQRFWDKVDKLGPIPKHVPGIGNCWVWNGAKRNGYGAIKVNGKMVSCHRLSLEWLLGRPLMAGLFACHKCDNPSCVRGDHLFEGSRSDNAIDSLTKGRSIVPYTVATRFQMGQPPPNRLLSTDEATNLVRDVISNKKHGGLVAIALKHGVPHQLARDISAGRSYIAIAKALKGDAGALDPGSNPGISSTV